MDHVWILLRELCNTSVISQNLGDIIVYVRHFLAAIGGETTRRCGRCVCMIDDSRPYYDLGCRKPEMCTCVLCCTQPPSLKSAASEIVFRICNKEKVRLNHVSSCNPVEIDSDFDFEFEWNFLSHVSPAPLPPTSPLTVRCASPSRCVSLPAEMLLQPTPCRE